MCNQSKQINWLYIGIFVMCIVVLVMPYIFTRSSFTGVEFTETGQIGDTIGGTTAPIIGLLSIFLLYLTLRSQLDFNKKQLEFNKTQQQAADFDILIKLQEKIALECDNIQFTIIDQTSGSRKSIVLEGSLNLVLNYLFDHGYRDYSIGADSFVGLYQQIRTIINLRILLLVTIEQSVLDFSILISIVDSLEIKLNPVVRALNDISENKFMDFSINETVIKEAKDLCNRDNDAWNKYKSKFLNYKI